MSTPLNERLRKAAANVHADPPEDLVARMERRETLSALLLEAADAVEASGPDQGA